MYEAIQISSIQHRRKDDVFYIYLSKHYNNVWSKLKERKIRVIVRIEIPKGAVSGDDKGI
ncbi:MAG: hypothetical protein DRO40_10155 [Thermoprotei archaeon]|nr:MAG: hypothetical protein DRO40_10155 [Thermoprotei archaeon]